MVKKKKFLSSFIVFMVFSIEIETSKIIQPKDLKGLASFMDEHPEAILLYISINDVPYQKGKILITPWNLLFEKEYLNLSLHR